MDREEEEEEEEEDCNTVERDTDFSGFESVTRAVLEVLPFGPRLLLARRFVRIDAERSG